MKRIEQYLKFINNNLSNEFNEFDVCKDLICLRDRDLSALVKDKNVVFSEISDKNKKYCRIVDKGIKFSNIDNDIKSLGVEIFVFSKIEYSSEVINKLFEFLIKKKIEFNGKIEIYDNVGCLRIIIKNIEHVVSVVDFVNCKLGKYIFQANPLFFSDNNVMLSICGVNYSYIEIIAMYLCDFIGEMRCQEKAINYSNFKDYMIINYANIETEKNMDKYLSFNKKNVKLSEFYSDLDVITNTIMYLFNGNDWDEFKNYYGKLKKKNTKYFDKYLMYDEIDSGMNLFEEIVTCMYANYGEEYTKNNLINYMNSGKLDYITRKNNLRNEVMKSNVFLVFLKSINFDDEFNRISKLLKIKDEKKILENICKEIFLTYFEQDINSAKIQVAGALIRMGYGDYSAITRSNNVRQMAVENIKADRVVDLIKSTLEIGNVRTENELYELYADYIERICLG